MESGEKELRKVFEEVTTNNVKAILEHGNTTRKIVRDLEDRIRQQDNLLQQYEQRMQTIQNQITLLQSRVFSGGTV